MLFSYFLTFTFFRFSQAGFYFDFFMKKIAEIFVRNVFVYTAQFFGEKYFIEIFTKKIIDSTLYNFNKWFGWTQLFYITYFVQFLNFFFYLLTLLNFFYFL